MAEIEKKINEELLTEKISTRSPISEPIKRFYRKRSKRASIFFTQKIPFAESELKSWVKSFRGGIILLTLFLVIVLPLLIDSIVYYHVFIVAMVYAIYAASWDLLSGVTGQVSFGHAAFFGLGGYMCAALVKYLGFHWLPSIIIGGALGVFFGLIVAIPSLRLKGPYLALGSLAFSLLIYGLFSMESLGFLFFGSAGIRNIPFLEGISLATKLLIEFIIALVIMIICIVIMLIVYNSKFGTIFKGIRDDEYATEAAGINVTKYKLISFCISAFFAGIAGSLYALHRGNIKPDIFTSIYSFYPIIMVVVGGISTISGAAFGAYFFYVLNEVITQICGDLLPSDLQLIFSSIATLFFAIILLLVVRFTERGLMEPTIKRSKDLWDLLRGK
ncbi:MAG: branched-chain amino acid ABC transporter permease [Promethearchaeota archaeon]